MVRKIHVAVFSMLYAAQANPTLPILSTLVRRGYRVTCVTAEAFASRVTAAGAEAITCRCFNPDAISDQIKSLAPPPPTLNVPEWALFCGLAVGTLAEVTSFYENNRPDLIIYDFVAFAGRILASRWHIPAIQTSPHYAFDRGHFNEQIKDREFRDWILELSRSADRFLEGYGIAADGFIFHREELNIYLFPRAFEPPGTGLSDPRCLYAGRCAAEQPCYGGWQKANDDGTPIAVIPTSKTYARDADYFMMFIDAFAGLPWQAVLLVGEVFDISELGFLPDNFEVVKGTPLLKVIPQARLLICQGGTISTAEAAYHGIPSIAVTCGFQEVELCAETNIVRLGVGVHLRKADMRVESIRQAVLRISEDKEIFDNVKQLSRAVRREPGAEEVVNRIEDFLEGR